MELAKKMIATTFLTGILLAAQMGIARADDDLAVWRTMKPLYAISLQVGRKHVLSYFLDKGSWCELTVMVTDQPDKVIGGNELPVLATTRFISAIEAGSSVHLDASSGTALAYACATDAKWMTVRKVYHVAIASPLRRK